MFFPIFVYNAFLQSFQFILYYIFSLFHKFLFPYSCRNHINEYIHPSSIIKRAMVPFINNGKLGHLPCKMKRSILVYSQIHFSNSRLQKATFATLINSVRQLYRPTIKTPQLTPHPSPWRIFQCFRSLLCKVMIAYIGIFTLRGNGSFKSSFGGLGERDPILHWDIIIIYIIVTYPNHIITKNNFFI